MHTRFLVLLAQSMEIVSVVKYAIDSAVPLQRHVHIAGDNTPSVFDGGAIEQKYREPLAVSANDFVAHGGHRPGKRCRFEIFGGRIAPCVPVIALFPRLFEDGGTVVLRK